MPDDRALGSRQKKAKNTMRSKLSSEVKFVHDSGGQSLHPYEQIFLKARNTVESSESKTAMDLGSRTTQHTDSRIPAGRKRLVLGFSTCGSPSR